MLKKILIGLGAVLGVVVLGLVALAVFFDANKYKPEIQQYVLDHYKRTLTFQGDLSLSVFPRFAIALPPTTLSNRGGDRSSASLKGAKVSVAVLPLLRGRVEVGTVSIDGLTATIERRRGLTYVSVDGAYYALTRCPNSQAACLVLSNLPEPDSRFATPP